MAHLVEGPGPGASSVAVAMDRNGSRAAPLVPDSRKQASRLLLALKLRDIRKRLDSLREDSLDVPPEQRPRFRRAFLAAAEVLSFAEGRLGELKRRELEADPRKWEILRTRLERTLFGLNRFLRESEDWWIPAVRLKPPPL